MPFDNMPEWDDFWNTPNPWEGMRLFEWEWNCDNETSSLTTEIFHRSKEIGWNFQKRVRDVFISNDTVDGLRYIIANMEHFAELWSDLCVKMLKFNCKKMLVKII